MKGLQLAATALLGGLAIASLTGSAHAQIAVGGCVTMHGDARMVFNVVGQSDDGSQWHIVSTQWPTSAGQWERTARLDAANCPGVQTGGKTCFATTSEDAGSTQEERIVIHSLVYTFHDRSEFHYAVNVTEVSAEAPREATEYEHGDRGDADFSQPVFDAKATYQTCEDDGHTLKIVTYKRNLLCIVSRSTGAYNCEATSTSNLQDAQEQDIPKY